jgi:DNA-binding transcriptional ArsR family regulator
MRRIGDLDVTFSALGDPIRRAMVERLAQSGLSVSELAKPFPVSLPAISKHLKILEGAGLIRKEKAGRTITCHLNPSPLISTATWISHYRPLWEKQLEQLSAYLEEEKNRK